MPFELSEEEKAIQSSVREFARKEFAPFVPQIEEEDEIPPIVREKLKELRITRIPFEEKYGGIGSTFTSFVVAVEEIAQVCAPIANLPMEGVFSTLALRRFGTEEQKKKYMIPLGSSPVKG